MKEPGEGPRRLVSGRWHGYYEQMGAHFAQEQDMEFADGYLRGSGGDGLGPFRIEGEYRAAGGEVRFGWIKTYREAHSLLYLGVLDGGWIRGEWHLQGAGSGTFGFEEPAR